ncbi:MAG TPA: DUF1592 domain-containing protein, partial [Polyangiaceae bacterium]|nr:DUF1592 domain-containing protein [Polyangiaceae bacterium]
SSTAGTSSIPGGGTSAGIDLGLSPGDAPIARMHKLTASEFANTVHDLLGSDAPLSPVEPDNIVSGFSSVGASTVAISAAGVGEYEAATGSATAFAFASAAKAATVLSCVPTTMTDTACLTKGLNAIGRRAFRRPLTADETTRFVNLATTIASGTGGTVLMGLQHAVWAMLQSPSFLYRVELGVASPADGGRLKYTSYEVASRLAGTIWNGAPDDAVLDAAGADSLSTPDGIRTQAQRMLADPKAHRGVLAFVDDLYNIARFEEAAKDPTLFPKWTPTLQAAMRQELEQRIDDMFFTTKGDFLSLYDGKTTFVNKELASYYGLPAPAGDGFEKATFPDDSPRVGLLGAGAILAAYALPTRASPTERGKFVTGTLLCINVPPPPPNVPALPDMLAPNETMRQIMATHRANPSCASCHSVMDPVGFGLDHFDSAAGYRTTENGQSIDATGTLTDGTAFDGLAQLGAALHKEPVAGPCFVSKMYENSLGRTALTLDNAAIMALAKQFSDGQNHADQLLLNLVGSDSFRFVDPS